MRFPKRQGCRRRGCSRRSVAWSGGGTSSWRPHRLGRPPNVKREGWGSGRALRTEWVVRATPAGRERRRSGRRSSTRSTRAGRIGSAWRRSTSYEARFARSSTDSTSSCPSTCRSSPARTGWPRDSRLVERGAAGESRGHLSALLSQALLAYTLDFEHESELSLPLSSNFVRVLDETGLHVSALPRAAAVSKEATSMALTFLTKGGHVDVAGTSAATKRARLTAKGLEVQKGLRGRHDQVERAWRTRFGAGDVRTSSDRRSRACLPTTTSLEGCIRTPAAGARASPTSNSTEAMLEDPRSALPHYPLVLHRGGWPDGS